MKRIKYTFRVVVTDGMDEKGNPIEREILTNKTMLDTEENRAVAAEEAYKGEYTIEDDGEPEPEVTPSQLDVIEAQVTYTAMMTDTLLEV